MRYGTALQVFRADNGSTYIVWKTDDNSLQAKLTRIWIQEIVIDAESGTVQQLGAPLKILDSESQHTRSQPHPQAQPATPTCARARAHTYVHGKCLPIQFPRTTVASSLVCGVYYAFPFMLVTTTDALKSVVVCSIYCCKLTHILPYRRFGLVLGR
eukprot:COSAG06_NODE_407_length_16111_cov_3.252748_10_plen_156_part_00